MAIRVMRNIWRAGKWIVILAVAVAVNCAYDAYKRMVSDS